MIDPTPPSLPVRAAAMLYEAVLLFAVLFAAGFAWTLALQWTPPLTVWQKAATFAFEVAVLGLYFVWQWRRGGTLPMKTWRLRLARADGGPLTVGRATARFALAWMLLLPAAIPIATLNPGPVATMVLLLVSPLAMLATALVDRERQMPYDRWLGLRLTRELAATRSTR
ncbi:MAG: RDD family protein [Burkholderiales bacterium]|jgi:uncharacterized RDD family membrane protein YckC|nr:RDD family protein [Burkholderiales bacterium]